MHHTFGVDSLLSYGGRGSTKDWHAPLGFCWKSLRANLLIHLQVFVCHRPKNRVLGLIESHHVLDFKI
jgi:hypothetical protein